MSRVRFEDYEKLVHKLTHRGHARLVRAGVAVEYEEVFQEFSMTWVKARNKFDPNLGFQFTTYFVNAAWINFNRFADTLRVEARKTRSLDAPLTSDGLTLADVVASDEPDAEEITMRSEIRKRVMDKLSPLSRKVVETIESPPGEILNEFRKLQARVQHGRDAGIGGRRLPQEMGLGFVMRLMGLSSAQRTAVKGELERVARN